MGQIIEWGNFMSNHLEMLLEQEGIPQKACFVLQENAIIEDVIAGNNIRWKQNDIITVQFNPTQYNMKKSSHFQPKANFEGKYDNSYGAFQNESPRTLSMTLLFDAFFESEQKSGAKTSTMLSFQTENIMGESNMMRAKKEDKAIDLQKTYIEKIMSLASISKDTLRPPLITFQYGSIRFTGYMETVDVTYKRFDREGEPIRAEISLSMKESKKE